MKSVDKIKEEHTRNGILYVDDYLIGLCHELMDRKKNSLCVLHKEHIMDWTDIAFEIRKYASENVVVE